MSRRINYTIDTSCCGDNSDAENERYASAVADALRDEYHDADISVELGQSVVNSVDFDSDSEDEFIYEYDEIRDNINDTANYIWDSSDY